MILPSTSWRHLQRRLLGYKFWIVSGLLALLLVPFLALCFFNVPYWDDYGNAADTRSIGWLKAVSNLYLGWTGRYTASVWLTALNPLSYGWENGVAWFAFGLFVATIWVQAFVLRTLTQDHLRWPAAIGWSVVWLLCQLYSMPSLSGGFYWFASTVTYQVAILMTLLMLAAAMRTSRAKSPGARVGWYTLAAGLGIGVAGSNELALVSLVWLLLVLTGLAWWQGEQQRRNRWLGLLLITTAAGVASLAAPGNFNRLGVMDEQIDQFTPVQILTHSIGASVTFIAEARHLTPLLVLPVLMSGVAYRMRRWRPAGLQLPLPLGVAIVFAGLLGCFLVLTRTWGDYPALRSLNHLWFWLLTGWLLVLWAAMPAELPNPDLRRKLAFLRVPALLFTLFVVFASKDLESWRAWRELLKDAAPFKAQMVARSQTIRAAAARGQRVVSVEGLPQATPRKIMMLGDPLDTMAASTMNQALAKWYRVDSLRVRKLNMISFAECKAI